MTGLNGIQQNVGVQPAPAVAGDFCDGNPRYAYDAGPGGLVSGADGVTIGRFAWARNPGDANATPSTVYSYGNGEVSGFVHRNQQGLITTYLADAGLTIPEGFQMGLMIGGGFWVKNEGSNVALPGMKAYATFTNGAATFAATGTPTGGGTATGTIAAGASSFTGSIAGDVLTASAVTDLIVPGELIAGSGITTGTRIVEQVSGTANGAGEYIVSIGEQDVTDVSCTGSYGLFTAASGLSGTFAVGQPLSGSGVADGTYISALGTGTGGLGTYYVNNTQTVGSTAISSASNIETKWYCRSVGGAGELVKISDKPLG
ncbi:MAG: hypothetical protein GC190_19415 [Alphaproteobacteria bacterium]|nr:hypothetical protein [Alphaproteobacteria bacterium]